MAEETRTSDVAAAVSIAAKPAYEVPTATFVPLQIEERLMACQKVCSPAVMCYSSPPATS